MDEHNDVVSAELEEVRKARREQARQRRETTYFRLQFERLNGRKPTDAELRFLIRARRKRRTRLQQATEIR